MNRFACLSYFLPAILLLETSIPVSAGGPRSFSVFAKQFALGVRVLHLHPLAGQLLRSLSTGVLFVLLRNDCLVYPHSLGSGPAIDNV